MSLGWHRSKGYTTILAHPDSAFGRMLGLTRRFGWAYVGTTRLGITDEKHPGLYVYEDRSLLGRWRRLKNTGRDELRERAMRAVGGKTW